MYAIRTNSPFMKFAQADNSPFVMLQSWTNLRSCGCTTRQISIHILSKSSQGVQTHERRLATSERRFVWSIKTMNGEISRWRIVQMENCPDGEISMIKRVLMPMSAYFLMFLCCSFSFLTRSSCALRAFASMVWASVWWACLSAWNTRITANVMIIEIILSDCNTRIAANVMLIVIVMSAWNTSIAANVIIIEIIM